VFEEGISGGTCAHSITLKPFPLKILGEIIKKYKKVLIPENELMAIVKNH